MKPDTGILIEDPISKVTFQGDPNLGCSVQYRNSEKKSAKL